MAPPDLSESQTATPVTTNFGAGWGMTGIVVFTLSVALYFGRPIFIPAVIALLLACLLWPAVGWIARRGLPWAVACTLVVGLVVLVLAGFGYAVSTTVPDFAGAIPRQEGDVQRVYARTRERIGRIAPAALQGDLLPPLATDSHLIRYIRHSFNPKNPTFFDNTWLGVGAVLYLVMETTLVLFLLFFLLLEGHLLSRRLVEAISPDAASRKQTVLALRAMAEQVRCYLFWRTVINVVMAVLLGVIFQLCGLEQPWTWAVLSSILLYVPYLGTVLAGIPPVLDAFVSVDSPWVAVGILIFYVALVTVEGYFIVPLVMGRSLELNATTVLLTTLYWEVVWGPAGLFLSMPLMAMAKTICSRVPGWAPWGRLMDTQAEPAKK